MKKKVARGLGWGGVVLPNTHSKSTEGNFWEKNLVNTSRAILKCSLKGSQYFT